MQVRTAASLATIKELESDDGKAFRHLYSVGEKLMNGLREAIDASGMKAQVIGLAPQFNLLFTELAAPQISDYRKLTKVDHQKDMKLRSELFGRGIFSGNPEWMLSVAHDENDIDNTVAIVQEALKAI